MFGKSFHLFTFLGFEIKVDLSWIFIAVFITWSLAAGIFPQQVSGLSQTAYYVMGIFGALGLFGSIILHEAGHAYVARLNQIPMKGITLFIFGGVAEMIEEPKAPRQEFLVAIAGPIVSIVLGTFLVLFSSLTHRFLPMSAGVVISYLGIINIILAVFNMIPAFPLDGGRVLRSVLWKVKGNLRWATGVAAGFGTAFGWVLIGLGILSVLNRNWGGLWSILIGMFVQGAAASSYQSVVIRETLQNLPVSKFMTPHPITVSPHLTLQHVVEDYIYRYHFKMFPVVEDGKLLGCVTTRQIKEVPREEWSQRTVANLIEGKEFPKTITPNEDSAKAFALMNLNGTTRLMVVHGEELVGIITAKDLLDYLSVKLELETGSKGADK